MGAKKAKQSGMTDLRRRAEDRLKAKPQATGASSKADPQNLLQDLQIHQVELDAERKELLRLKNETEELLAEYLYTYDFAPVGYFTLGPTG